MINDTKLFTQNVKTISKRPCKDCPFRRSTVENRSVRAEQGQIRYILTMSYAHRCHMASKITDKGIVLQDPNVLCAGAIVYRERWGVHSSEILGMLCDGSYQEGSIQISNEELVQSVDELEALEFDQQ